MTFDEFLDQSRVCPDCRRRPLYDPCATHARETEQFRYLVDNVALRRVFDHLVATGANIGDVLRGEVKPSPKPALSELRELAKQMDTMGYQSAAWPESQEAYAWCAEMLTAALDRLGAK